MCGLGVSVFAYLFNRIDIVYLTKSVERVKRLCLGLYLFISSWGSL